MGETFFKIKRLVENGTVKAFSSNFRLYGDMSWRVMKTLEQWCSSMEIYSVDEAFLDFADFNDDEKTLGRTIVSTIKQWTGIPVSVGFAPTKTLCKIASEIAKQREETFVCSLMNETVRIEALKSFDVADVWGVGRRLAPRFQKLGIRTAYDFSMIDPLWMRKNHSVIQEKIVHELRGEPCFCLDDVPEPKKSIQVSRSFGEATEQLEDLEEAVATFAAKAAEKARAQGSVASAVYVHINTSRFRQDKSEYYSQGIMIGFPIPTASSFEIIEYALSALRRIYISDKPYKKATVILHELKDADTALSQGFLFEKDDRRDTQQRNTERKLMETMDAINRQHGKGAVFLGVEGIRKTWSPKQETVSPCYTTRLSDLPLVK